MLDCRRVGAARHMDLGQAQPCPFVARVGGAGGGEVTRGLVKAPLLQLQYPQAPMHFAVVRG